MWNHIAWIIGRQQNQQTVVNGVHRHAQQSIDEFSQPPSEKNCKHQLWFRRRPIFDDRGGSSRGAAGLQPPLKNVRQKIPPNGQTRLKFGFSCEISQHNHFRYFRHHFGSTFPRNPRKPMFRSFPLFQRRRSCDDVFSTLADESGGFGAVFGTALKERNQTIGYKKHSGISAYRKAFLLFWRWIFKEKTEEIWSWLFFTTWFSWILNFRIKFNNRTAVILQFYCYALKMITVVIETFARCQLYRLLWQ